MGEPAARLSLDDVLNEPSWFAFGYDPPSGTIGFVGPLAELFGGAPALLLGIEDPMTNAHAPNESLHAGDFRKLTASLAHLFQNLGALPGGRVK